ncbi:hypothetical protein CEUSTIGMA_g12590.t1 [Chlamydomonas eustigma]|uniref:Uncharacterized protein n=1 Tax=Chlamydomonas eustigma TaxID=1157962 RepID=A0A250XQF7_9CHLO|nr:hypothetical protein CEUSTIGMA_g12590.t1 [Chlamydomonas eustigma]|eukprot:GAX85172.1 hypothetical protein CEUSTIGMA_g12590.t1 [Chlamydomonas eustigma]
MTGHPIAHRGIPHGGGDNLSHQSIQHEASTTLQTAQAKEQSLKLNILIQAEPGSHKPLIVTLSIPDKYAQPRLLPSPGVSVKTEKVAVMKSSMVSHFVQTVGSDALDGKSNMSFDGREERLKLQDTSSAAAQTERPLDAKGAYFVIASVNRESEESKAKAHAVSKSGTFPGILLNPHHALNPDSTHDSAASHSMFSSMSFDEAVPYPSHDDQSSGHVSSLSHTAIHAVHTLQDPGDEAPSGGRAAEVHTPIGTQMHTHLTSSAHSQQQQQQHMKQSLPCIPPASHSLPPYPAIAPHSSVRKYHSFSSAQERMLVEHRPSAMQLYTVDELSEMTVSSHAPSPREGASPECGAHDHHNHVEVRSNLDGAGVDHVEVRSNLDGAGIQPEGRHGSDANDGAPFNKNEVKQSSQFSDLQRALTTLDACIQNDAAAPSSCKECRPSLPLSAAAAEASSNDSLRDWAHVPPRTKRKKRVSSSSSNDGSIDSTHELQQALGILEKSRTVASLPVHRPVDGQQVAGSNTTTTGSNTTMTGSNTTTTGSNTTTTGLRKPSFMFSPVVPQTTQRVPQYRGSLNPLTTQESSAGSAGPVLPSLSTAAAAGPARGHIDASPVSNRLTAQGVEQCVEGAEEEAELMTTCQDSVSGSSELMTTCQDSVSGSSELMTTCQDSVSGSSELEQQLLASVPEDLQVDTKLMDASGSQYSRVLDSRLSQKSLMSLSSRSSRSSVGHGGRETLKDSRSSSGGYHVASVSNQGGGFIIREASVVDKLVAGRESTVTTMKSPVNNYWVTSTQRNQVKSFRYLNPTSSGV